MEIAEDRLIKLSECEAKRSYITIEMDGKPFKVRTYVIGDITDGKKTLVILHGRAGFGTQYFNIWKELSQRYRLIFFDNLGWGLNTRLQGCSGTESPEAAEQWIIDWILKTFEALDLPPKFLLAGKSYGGWLASLYASFHPEKVEALFLISPAGTEAYNEETYDPYN